MLIFLIAGLGFDHKGSSGPGRAGIKKWLLKQQARCLENEIQGCSKCHKSALQEGGSNPYADYKDGYCQLFQSQCSHQGDPFPWNVVLSPTAMHLQSIV